MAHCWQKKRSTPFRIAEIVPFPFILFSISLIFVHVAVQQGAEGGYSIDCPWLFVAVLPVACRARSCLWKSVVVCWSVSAFLSKAGLQQTNYFMDCQAIKSKSFAYMKKVLRKISHFILAFVRITEVRFTNSFSLVYSVLPSSAACSNRAVLVRSDVPTSTTVCGRCCQTKRFLNAWTTRNHTSTMMCDSLLFTFASM